MQDGVRFLSSQSEFNSLAKDLASHEWFGFDTEFIGEKSFVPKLCLMQLVTDEGIFLIDTLQIKDLSIFLSAVENPNILKITHAGDNDYRLLNQLYGTVPQNTFDTQIAAGFCGYNYPSGFSKIVDGELRIQVKKGFAVADWNVRPLPQKILQYAIDDVLYLPDMWRSLSQKLEKNGRTEWAREENRVWEQPQQYDNDPYREAFGSDFIYTLKRPSQIFLMRLYAWRLEMAANKDVPKEAILPNKHIGNIVKAINKGGNALRNNRTLPAGLVKKHLDAWEQMYRSPITPEEQQLLNDLPPAPQEDPNLTWSLELAYHLVKKVCMDNDMSASLLLPRGVFNILKDKRGKFDRSYLQGWRREMLGEELAEWLVKRQIKKVDWNDGVLHIR